MEADHHEPPGTGPARSVFARHYDRLVRIAYLVAAAPRRRAAGLVRAHRTVQRCLPLRAHAELSYPDLVARVLRRAARPRRWAPPALMAWARPAPLDGERGHRLVTVALAAAPAPVRAAYVLLMVERMPAREAALVLRAAGWPEAVAHVAASTVLSQRLADEYGLSPQRQRELLAEAPADPTVARLRGPHPDTLRALRVLRLTGVAVPLAVVAALLAATVTGVPTRPPTAATMGAWAEPEPTAVAVRRVAAQAWTAASEPTLASWPARGALAGDDELIGRALAAWRDGPRRPQLLDAAGARTEAARGSRSGPRAAGVTLPVDDRVVTVAVSGGATADPPVDTRLLYAGELDGATVAVLADASRIATYAVLGEERILRIAPAPPPAAEQASVLRIGHPSGPARYLVAPWVTRVEARSLGTGSWRRLPVTDGVTAAAPTPAADDCWAGPLLRVRSAKVGDGAPVVLADLGNTVPAELRRLPSTMDGTAADATAADAWDRLGCALGEFREDAPAAVTAREVWAGALPGAPATARVYCLRADLPGDANRVAAVLVGPGTGPATTVASAAATPLCSRRAPEVAVAWWWRSPTGAWHHVAVGSDEVAALEVTVARRTRDGQRLVASGRQPAATGPVVVRATDPSGRPVPVLR